jgi:hypothetical protein
MVWHKALTRTAPTHCGLCIGAYRRGLRACVMSGSSSAPKSNDATGARRGKGRSAARAAIAGDAGSGGAFFRGGNSVGADSCKGTCDSGNTATVQETPGVAHRPWP